MVCPVSLSVHAFSIDGGRFGVTLTSPKTEVRMNCAKRSLLIVDDEELVCRGILRTFKRTFDDVQFAIHPDEAERILKRGEVTHLVCDYHLGETLPNGVEWMERWRKAYPKIQRAVLYSGADLSEISPSRWVDFKISKSHPIRLLVNAVLFEEQILEIQAWGGSGVIAAPAGKVERKLLTPSSRACRYRGVRPQQ